MTAELPTAESEATGWAPAPRDRRGFLIGAVVLLLLAGLVAALYGDTLRYPFQYDDRVEILANPAVTVPPPRLQAIFDYNPFRVGLLLSFAVDYLRFGDRPMGYRTENLIIHGLNAWLLWLLTLRALAAARRRRTLAAHLDGAGSGERPAEGEAPAEGEGPTTGTPLRWALLALPAGLLLAAHPLAVEAVTYISGRSSSLASTFWLLALLAWDCAQRELDEGAEVLAPLRALLPAYHFALIAISAVVVALSLVLTEFVRAEEMSAGRALAAGLAAVLLVGTGLVLRVRERLPDGPAFRAALQPMRFWLLSVGLFLVGLTIKEIVVSLPAIFFLWTLLLAPDPVQPSGPARRSGAAGGSERARLARAANRTATLFLVPALLAAARLAVYRFLASPEPLRPVFANLRTEWEVLLRYLGLVVGIGQQSLFHDHPVAWDWSTRSLVGLSVLLGLAGLAIAWRRRAPVISLGLAWFLIAITPTSSVFPLKETMAEHRVYLPGLGLAIAATGALVLLVGRWRTSPQRRAVAVALFGLLLVLPLASRTRAYNESFASLPGPWLRAVELNPRAAGAWRNLGDLARQDADCSAAIEHYERALALRPTDAETHNVLGICLARAGQAAQARRHFQRALQERPCFAAAFNNMGTLHWTQGQADQAVLFFERSLGCPGNPFEASYMLGRIYDSLGSGQQAADYYLRAIDAWSENPLVPFMKQRLQDLTW